MSSSLTEYLLKVSKAPSNSSFVTTSLNRATTFRVENSIVIKFQQWKQIDEALKRTAYVQCIKY